MKGMKTRSSYDNSQDSQMFVYRSTCQDQREKTKWMKNVEELHMMPDCQVFIMVLIQGATREWFSP